MAGLRGDISGTDLQWDIYGSFGRTNADNILFGQGSLSAVNTLLAAPDGGASISGVTDFQNYDVIGRSHFICGRVTFN